MPFVGWIPGLVLAGLGLLLVIAGAIGKGVKGTAKGLKKLSDRGRGVEQETDIGEEGSAGQILFMSDRVFQMLLSREGSAPICRYCGAELPVGSRYVVPRGSRDPVRRRCVACAEKDGLI